MRNKLFWAAIPFALGLALWGFGSLIGGGPIGRLFINEEAVDRHIKENASTVIDLKDGRQVIGRVSGETPKRYFIQDIKGSEEIIDRSAVKAMRAPSAEEIAGIKDYLVRHPALLKKERVLTAKEKEAQRQAAEARYEADVAAARRAGANLERRLAEERAKEEAAKAQEEGRTPPSKMRDSGMPAMPGIVIPDGY